MCRHRYSMRAGLRGLQNDMAANLMHPLVGLVSAEVQDQFFAAEVARQLHATASTSSRTRRSRIDAGGALSK